jgi:hypothetical protein
MKSTKRKKQQTLKDKGLLAGKRRGSSGEQIALG